MKKLCALIVVVLLCAVWIGAAMAEDDTGLTIKLTKKQLKQIKHASQLGNNCTGVQLTPSQVVALKQKYNNLEGNSFKVKICINHIFNTNQVVIDSTLTGIQSKPH